MQWMFFVFLTSTAVPRTLMGKPRGSYFSRVTNSRCPQARRGLLEGDGTVGDLPRKGHMKLGKGKGLALVRQGVHNYEKQEYLAS
jgi:hypothetical protein